LIERVALGGIEVSGPESLLAQVLATSFQLEAGLSRAALERVEHRLRLLLERMKRSGG
jgi:hypothetical protein